MKPECAEAMKKGTLLKVQNFETAKGVYRLAYIRYNGDIYMFKTRDGVMLECGNLNKMKGVPIK